MSRPTEDSGSSTSCDLTSGQAHRGHESFSHFSEQQPALFTEDLKASPAVMQSEKKSTEKRKHLVKKNKRVIKYKQDSKLIPKVPSHKIKQDHKSILMEAEKLLAGGKFKDTLKGKELAKPFLAVAKPVKDSLLPESSGMTFPPFQLLEDLPLDSDHEQDSSTDQEAEFSPEDSAEYIPTGDSSSKTSSTSQELLTDDQGPKLKKKRARPFTREELEAMVKFIDDHDYDEAKRGHIHEHKGAVMHRLATFLYANFGIKRSKRQVQKRWHDLKNRELKTLHEIRAKRREEEKKRQELIIISSEHDSTAMDSSPGKEPMKLSSPKLDGDMVTLTLHPVTYEPGNPMTASQESEGVIPAVDLEERIERMICTQIKAAQDNIIREFQRVTAVLIRKINTLCAELEDVKKNCYLVTE